MIRPKLLSAFFIAALGLSAGACNMSDAQVQARISDAHAAVLKGNRIDAVKSLEAVVAARPGNIQAASDLIASHVLDGEFAKARDILLKLRSTTGDSKLLPQWDQLVSIEAKK
jgi:hypothetical protein